MSFRFPRLAAAAVLLAGAITGALTVGVAAPAFAENSPTSIPIAVDDNYTMLGGTTLTVQGAAGLLGNDLHAAAWTILFVEAVQNDVPGELALESVYKNGEFTYTPDPSFSGVRTFEYQVRDGDLGVVSDNWGLVTITVLDPTLPCEVSDPVCGAGSNPGSGPGGGSGIPCVVGEAGCGPQDACQAGTPGCVPPVIPPCDPNGPIMAAPGPGDEPTCIGDPGTGGGSGIPCIVGSSGCPAPGDSGPGGGSGIPCVVGTAGCGPQDACEAGTPGCTPPTIPTCDPDALPQEAGNSEPCIPAKADDPVPATVIDTTTGSSGGAAPGDGGTSAPTQLPTLAYTGATVDFRLAGLAALLLVGGVILALPRRRAA